MGHSPEPCRPHPQLGAVPLPAGSVLTPQPEALGLHWVTYSAHKISVPIFSTAIRIAYPTLVLSHANPPSSHSSQ